MANGYVVESGDFYSTLTQFVKENIDRNQGQVEGDIKQAAEICVDTITAEAPKDTGDYAKGWKHYDSVSGDGEAKSVCANATKPSLTHLLENGHEVFTQGWGDAYPKDRGFRTRAIPHIETGYEAGAAYLEGLEVDNS